MGRYIGKSDIDTIFGAVNVAKWSNLDNLNDAASPDIARIAAAIAWAEDYVDERLRMGVYTTPWVAPAPRTIKDVVARMAGVWLYEARGMDDFESQQDNPVARNKTEAERTINKILRGEIAIVGDLNGTHPTAPFFQNSDNGYDWFQWW